jgi:hypothetical protein
VDVVQTLHRIDDDLGWAIVSIVEKTQGRTTRRSAPEAELVEIGGGQSLIAVDPVVFGALPGVQMAPLSSRQAFLALESGQGMADLESAVRDRLAQLTPASRSRPPLKRLLTQLHSWRRSRALHFQTRSIIVVSHRQSHRR